ncbi:MAG: cobalt-precorrin-6A reductase [Phycicoccus sp.]|nr:cobalt-precorrin-6A reductase [Phycicoccus sp.]NMM35024.1 cobalt-precorrin-6A reductase [Phycicoccus sp.]
MVIVNVMPRVLILGGTSEARRLAERLFGRADVDVVSSLAGRVASPRMPAGQVRVGGFGGAAGLTEWIRAHGIRAVIDATHPFAATMSWNAAAAAADSHVPLLALRRTAWVPGEGDRWHEARSLEDAAWMLPELGERHFLTIGRQGVASFADVTGAWFLVRCIDPPDEPTPPQMELLLDRGPYSLETEIALMRGRRIDTVITKNSGGAATAAKLIGARELGLPVVMVQRPATPGGVPEVADVQGAVEWVDAQIR